MDAFEALRGAPERRERARELAAEIRELIVGTSTPDGAVSAILGRLRLVGHPLYPLGDGLFAGHEGETGLRVQFRSDEVEVSYDPRR